MGAEGTERVGREGLQEVAWRHPDLSPPHGDTTFVSIHEGFLLDPNRAEF